MLKLPQVTLICLTNKDFVGHKRALDKSCEGIEFGAVKMIWDEGIKDINDWNRKIIQDLYKYVDTDYLLLIHADGYVINPELWDNKWLEFDFIGSPFPLPTDNYSYLDDKGQLQRVGNSVSLRSRKLMKLVSTREWKYYFGNTNEDGFICCHNRSFLEANGCKFAPLEEAIYFSKEHTIPENVNVETFAFHALG